MANSLLFQKSPTLGYFTLGAEYVAGSGVMSISGWDATVLQEWTLGNGLMWCAPVRASGEAVNARIFKITSNSGGSLTVVRETGYAADANIAAGTEMAVVCSAEAMEQAILDAAPTIVTTVGDPGSDTSVPSEQAVREALTALPSAVPTEYGTFANLSSAFGGAPTAPSIYFFTDTIYDRAIYYSSAWHYFMSGVAGEVVPPSVAGTWTGTNLSTGSIATTLGFLQFKDIPMASSLRRAYITAPSPPFTIEAIFYQTNATGDARVGILTENSTLGKETTFTTTADGAGYSVQNWTGDGTWSGHVGAVFTKYGTSYNAARVLHFLKLVVNSTSDYDGYISVDRGAYWEEACMSRDPSAFMTSNPNRIGVAFWASISHMTLVSFKVS